MQQGAAEDGTGYDQGRSEARHVFRVVASYEYDAVLVLLRLATGLGRLLNDITALYPVRN